VATGVNGRRETRNVVRGSFLDLADPPQRDAGSPVQVIRPEMIATGRIRAMDIGYRLSSISNVQ
jgi:hypothetical protein